MSMPPTLHHWHDLKPPKIASVKSLGRTIPPERYGQVYWIAETVDNIVTEAHVLTQWYFMADGRLRGKVDTGVWKLEIEVQLSEFVILSVI